MALPKFITGKTFDIPNWILLGAGAVAAFWLFGKITQATTDIGAGLALCPVCGKGTQQQCDDCVRNNLDKLPFPPSVVAPRY